MNFLNWNLGLGRLESAEPEEDEAGLELNLLLGRGGFLKLGAEVVVEGLRLGKRQRGEKRNILCKGQ